MFINSFTFIKKIARFIGLTFLLYFFLYATPLVQFEYRKPEIYHFISNYISVIYIPALVFIAFYLVFLKSFKSSKKPRA